MQPKPYIAKLAKFLSFPFVVVSAVLLVVGFMLWVFWFLCGGACLAIRDIYNGAPAKTKARAHEQP